MKFYNSGSRSGGATEENLGSGRSRWLGVVLGVAWR